MYNSFFYTIHQAEAKSFFFFKLKTNKIYNICIRLPSISEAIS